jgi:putative ABC transport system permease protein
MNALLRDLRQAIRGLAKNPAISVVAILALAVGIGVNTSSFTAVNSMVLHPLAFPHQEQVMTLWESVPKRASERDAVAPANFLDWKEQNRTFEHVAAYRGWDVGLTGVDEPERIQGYLVTPDFFPLLGMKPIVGRTFRNDEAEPGHDQVVVVSRGFWQRRLAAAPDAAGKVISLGGSSYTVIGVMPDDFDYPLATDVWAPLAFSNEERNQRANRNLMVLGRLHTGMPVAQARAEMDTIGRRLEQRYPQTNEARGVLVKPLRELTNNVASRFVLILLSAAMFVLLLACANVANLQLARATGRQREIAIRAVLGASRLQIARQLVLETIVMALLGGVLGLFLAQWNVAWTRASFPPSVLRWMAGLRNFHIDASVLLFTLLASVLAGVLCGLPAIWHLLRRATAADINEVLKEGGRSNSAGLARGRLQGALVVAEVALALVLLVGAGLMVRSFQRMLTLNAGFNPKNLLTAQLSLPKLKYREDAQIAAFYQQVLQGLETLPDAKVSGAGANSGTPDGFAIEGRAELKPDDPRPAVRAIGGQYLQAMEIPVLRGRSIAAQDSAAAPRVVVLSESIVHHYWPDSDPIGRKIRLGDAKSPWLTVVGVSGEVRQWFTGEPMPAAYVSYLQSPSRSMSLRIRTVADPMSAAGGLRAKVREVDRNQPLYDVKSMDQVLSEETSGVRVSASTMSMYAVIALLLAATGIYAVISYSVVQRTHEVGVRMALGAGRQDVLRMMLARSVRLAGFGLAIGVPVAVALTLLMSSVLYNVVALEWPMFAAFTAVLGLSALLAGYIPARRAANVDPMVALRHE